MRIPDSRALIMVLIMAGITFLSARCHFFSFRVIKNAVLHTLFRQSAALRHYRHAGGLLFQSGIPDPGALWTSGTDRWGCCRSFTCGNAIP